MNQALPLSVDAPTEGATDPHALGPMLKALTENAHALKQIFNDINLKFDNILQRVDDFQSRTPHEHCQSALDDFQIWVENLRREIEGHRQWIDQGLVLQRRLSEIASALTCIDTGPFYRSLIENLPHYYFCKDREGRFIFANALFCGSLGKLPEEIVGKTDYDFFPPHLAEKYRRDDRWILETGRVLSTIEEHVVGRELKKKRWVQVIKTPIRGHDGSVIGTQALFWDITSQKLQQSVTLVLAEPTTLRDATAEILRAICESMGWDFGALWIRNRDSQMLRCAETWHVPTAEFAEIEKFSRRSCFRCGEGLSGRVWADGRLIWIPDIDTWVPEALGEAEFPQASIATRIGLRSAIGFPILLKGEVLGVLEFFSRDILQLRDPESKDDLLPVMDALGRQIGQYIERKRAEEERDHSLGLIQSIIDSSNSAIYVKDCECRYIFVNSWYAELFQCNQWAVKGKTDYDLFPARLADMYRENDQRVLRYGEPLEFEEVALHRD